MKRMFDKEMHKLFIQMPNSTHSFGYVDNILKDDDFLKDNQKGFSQTIIKLQKPCVNCQSNKHWTVKKLVSRF